MLIAFSQVGTPVTAESFAKWTIAKAARKQLEAEARVKAEQAKKKGGKGLCEYHAVLHLPSFLPSAFLSSFLFLYIDMSCPLMHLEVQ